MAIIVKCDPPNRSASGSCTVHVPTYRGARPSVGDVAFIWTSETAGGRGLHMRGAVDAAVLRDRLAELTIRVTDHAPRRSLTKAMLAPYRDSLGQGPLASLARKLFRHSLNKVAELDADEARYLEDFFRPGSER